MKLHHDRATGSLTLPPAAGMDCHPGTEEGPGVTDERLASRPALPCEVGGEREQPHGSCCTPETRQCRRHRRVAASSPRRSGRCRRRPRCRLRIPPDDDPDGRSHECHFGAAALKRGAHAQDLHGVGRPTGNRGVGEVEKAHHSTPSGSGNSQIQRRYHSSRMTSDQSFAHRLNETFRTNQRTKSGRISPERTISHVSRFETRFPPARPSATREPGSRTPSCFAPGWHRATSPAWRGGRRTCSARPPS